jgi:hypothetical protein
LAIGLARGAEQIARERSISELVVWRLWLCFNRWSKAIHVVEKVWTECFKD